MHIVLDQEEAWSFMTLVTAQILDQVEISQAGEVVVREWRTKLEDGSEPLRRFSDDLNTSLRDTIDKQLTRTVRHRDYYRKSR